MELRGIRFCQVSDPSDAAALAGLLTTLGISERDLGMGAEGRFEGAVFPTTGGESWVEVWPAAEGMEPGTMLQLVVDDADAAADAARAGGLDPQGPTDDHGERIYFLAGPGGLSISFQSRLPD